MPNSDKVNKAMEDKFLSKDKFAEEIESIVAKTKMNYIDAIIEYCSKNNIELDTVGKLISKRLKEKIRCEAQELNFLKKTSKGKLPL